MRAFRVLFMVLGGICKITLKTLGTSEVKRSEKARKITSEKERGGGLLRG